MATKLPIRDAVSAGGLIWRRSDAGTEVVLCGRKADRIWVLPKGTPDAGEAIEETAKREAEEETGLRVTVGARLSTIEYWFVSDGYRWHKYVHYWLMEPVGGDLEDHDHEFDEVRWFPSGEALALMTYENERVVLQEAMAALQAA